MKSVILGVVLAVAVGGFASSSYAQTPKKLAPHPTVAGDPSLLKGRVELPREGTTQSGKARTTVSKSKAGDAVAPGGSSTTGITRKLKPHPAVAGDPSLLKGRVELSSEGAAQGGKARTTVAKSKTGDAVAPGGSSTARLTKD